MTPRVAPHGPPGISRRCSRQQGGGGADQKCAKARGREIDQIVEARRSPAEGEVTRRLVADHAVCGVDRLVGDAAGQAGNRQPEGRCDHAIGEILRKALDRGARDARLVEALRVAADDMRDRDAAGFQSTGLERRGDGLDMHAQAALGQQAAGKHGKQQQAGPAGKQALQHKPRCNRNGKQHEQRGDAGHAARGRGSCVAIEAAVHP